MVSSGVMAVLEVEFLHPTCYCWLQNLLDSGFAEAFCNEGIADQEPFREAMS